MKNFVKDYYQNKKEILEHGMSGFFKTTESPKVKELKTKLKTLENCVQDLKAQLDEQYSNQYAEKYYPTNKKYYLCYNGRNRVKYYYEVGGNFQEEINVDDPSVEIIEVCNKNGNIEVIGGYAFEKGAVILKNYSYSIQTNSTKIKFNICRETVVPLLANVMPYNTKNLPCNITILPGMSRSGSEFLNTFYNIEVPENFLTLGEIRQCSIMNPSFEIIIKTCPERVVKKILQIQTTKPTPVHKILNLTKEEWDRIKNDDQVLLDFIHCKGYIENKENFNKTTSEWIDLLFESKEWKEELEFNQIHYNNYSCVGGSPICLLATEYSYEPKFRDNYSFGKFCKYVITESVNQGYTNIRTFISELRDYISMCAYLKTTPALYTSYLKQTHDVCARNHKIQLSTIEEQKFTEIYKNDKTVTVGKNRKFIVVPPKNSEQIKKEGDALNHCVASYIKRVLDGKTKIMFLREKEDESLITLEIRNNQICQARGLHNRAPSQAERNAISEYAKKMSLVSNY